MKYAKLCLMIDYNESEQVAKDKIRELKKEIEDRDKIVSESGFAIRFKITTYSFRLGKNIYSINSTENITSIRSEVFNYIVNYYRIVENDIVLQ